MSKTPDMPPAPPRKRRWLRGMIWAAAGLLVALTAANVVFPAVARSIIRAKLQAMIGDNLNAELRMGRLSYIFPYGVELGESSLVAKDQAGQSIELIHLPQARLELGRLPFGSGPLIIRNITLRQPAIHLIRNAEGFVGQRGLLRPETRPGERRAKLSEMFELRLVDIAQGQIVYDNRTLPGTVPLVWRGIDIRLTTKPQTNPIYEFDFVATNAPLADLHAAGTFDIDALDLVVAQLKMSAQLKAGEKESPAPPIIQQLLASNGIRGTMTMSGTAHVPLMDYAASTYDFRMELADAQARPGNWGRGLDSLSMKLGLASSPRDDAWRLLAAAMKLDRPTTAPARPVLFATVEDVRARSGENTVRLARGDAMLDWLAGRWMLPGVEANVHLATDADLPAPLRNAAEKANVVGDVRLSIRGDGSIYHTAGRLPPFQLDIHAASPKLLFTDRRLELADVACDIRLDPQGVQLIDDGKTRHGLLASAYAGQIRGSAQLAFASPRRWVGRLSITAVDLARLTPALAKPGQTPLKLSGRASVQVSASGALAGSWGSILDTLAASGDAEVVGGDFLQVPSLSQIAAMAGSRNAATVGQAAAVFSVAGRKIRVERVAVSAPVVGVVGSGEADFEGNLDFHLTAAPIADWKKQIKGTGIPILSDIGGTLAGAAQKFITSASARLLAFHVTGTIRRPTVKPEAAPAATQGAKDLFGEMVTGTGRLLDHVRREDRK